MAKTAVITGVGRRRGIGAGLAAGLAAEGWNLALSCWRPYDERVGLVSSADDPQRLADELAASGVRIELLPADLSDANEPERLLCQAQRRLGPIDALVMAHCESVDSALLTTTVESFDRHYAVNVRAAWLLIKALAQRLPATGSSVVALTSDHTVNNLPYGATKAALDRIVLAAAHELGPQGVRANVINPGPIDTGWMTPEFRTQLTAMQPTGRLGTPSDIANLVRFLLSDQGQWVNGQLIHCNGGFPKDQLPV
ncbi:SDR family oxidoreductase [Mycobacterium haemophilum]|uniref:Short-chain dehydrogenase n=1 Tax=Mycobacterium haemophilum TaxID=29311 RepID=A0A0I9U220_9MYCO|nr:SDR family oxidoreductase [Mycobacterium haemophilum]KLO31189.1 short-chain dehydrogenase [Mycobacterium haemophilum]KLO36114.1 short-chain dehydrogenase [Mycobacterium haemophilum]KLO41962.1 short-chain dehydrogenase [Mycobacterium haemophilum]KLO49872.1 short-chain dehydrogenase [Mycobacterium haemophilum]